MLGAGLAAAFVPVAGHRPAVGLAVDAEREQRAGCTHRARKVLAQHRPPLRIAGRVGGPGGMAGGVGAAVNGALRRYRQKGMARQLLPAIDLGMLAG